MKRYTIAIKEGNNRPEVLQYCNTMKEAKDFITYCKRLFSDYQKTPCKDELANATNTGRIYIHKGIF